MQQWEPGLLERDGWLPETWAGGLGKGLTRGPDPRPDSPAPGTGLQPAPMPPAALAAEPG